MENSYYTAIDRAYMNFGLMVVERAAKDYKNALKNGNTREILALEKFFLSSWLSFLAPNISGKAMIERIRDGVEQFIAMSISSFATGVTQKKKRTRDGLKIAYTYDTFAFRCPLCNGKVVVEKTRLANNEKAYRSHCCYCLFGYSQVIDDKKK